MAYLVRRLLENTSNESWLRGKFAEGKSAERLLQDPRDGMTVSSADLPPDSHFHNEALSDFAIANCREKLSAAIQTALSQTGRIYPLVINGKEVTTENKLARENPACHGQILGQVCLAGEKEAELAIQTASSGFATWRRTPAAERVKLVEKLADIMAKRRWQLIATQVLEVGKPWEEADGDVAEAIDFCRYYARDMQALAPGQRVGHVPGEISIYHYQPRGVALVIAPWNFPLAILTGMAAAALVTGNTVILKPAEQSSLVAAGLMDMIREAGFPPGAVQFLPGLGEVVGEYLVNHKDVATIAFTGSRGVGLHILQRASVVHPGQSHVKRCIIEMGGKNAVIVDSDADLDEAVEGVLYSAFGFAGQKCSACSRAIVLDEVYDKFEARLVEAVRSIKIGNPQNPSFYYGPVVDKEAHDRILQTIETAKGKHRLAFQGEQPTGGLFVPPTIFSEVDPQSALAQEEIFGPVLCLIRAKTLNEAITIANGTQYGLTGGIFSRSPTNIEVAREQMECGNLYINRGITGAMVDRHPFGGFKMSGIGSKTGGPDYLRQFMEPRCVTENSVRRGFAPESV